MTNKEVYELTKYLFESWDRGADYDNYHMDCQFVLEALAEQPAQRAWVGLTDEEIEAEFGFIDELLRDCCYRIEAKLKEKNT